MSVLAWLLGIAGGWSATHWWYLHYRRPGQLTRDHAAAVVEAMCDWTSDFRGARSILEPDHERWHLGYPCPYQAMATVLRGEPDPRREAQR